MLSDKFPLPLIVENLADGSQYHFRLAAPFKYVTRDRGVVSVPVGFETDFASVPRLFSWIPGFDGDNESAKIGTIHDYIYQYHSDIEEQTGVKFTRHDTDLLMYQGLMDSGLPEWEAEVYFKAVRVFGGDYWDKWTRSVSVVEGVEVLA
jgi:hypothetical protein